MRLVALPAAEGAALLTSATARLRSGKAPQPHFLRRQNSSRTVLEPGSWGAASGPPPPDGLQAFRSKLLCGKSMRVGSHSDKWERCPAECPLFAERAGNDVHCDFRCVEASSEACRTTNPHEAIVDSERGICRACMLEGCRQCATDGTDACAVCSQGYKLRDGKCVNQAWYVIIPVCVVALVLVGILAAWVVDLFRRPIVNQETLDYALKHRSHAKPHMPRDDDFDRTIWPLATNLLEEDVCGPGLRLQFNFQVAIIVWALTIGVGWVILALNDREFFDLGLHRAESARQNCIVVAFGYEAQQRLMLPKTIFSICAYIFSFAFFISLSVRHRRVFQETDAKELTYKDFTAQCSGLPLSLGAENVEEELKVAIAAATGQPVVGVSVCWDFLACCTEIHEALDAELEQRQREREGVDYNFVHQKSLDGKEDKCVVFRVLEDKLFGSALDADVPVEAEKMTRRLERMWSTQMAFVVFRTEAARNAAVTLVAERGGFEHKGFTVKMQKALHEPVSVKWRNVADRSVLDNVKRILGGLAIILLALCAWIAFFYAPYAYFAMNFNYAYGQEPGLEMSLAFTVVVVLGNAMMYITCKRVADGMGFVYAGHREVCYMLCYSAACIFNVMLDMVVTYNISYSKMVGMGMKTYHGVPLGKVTTFIERFQTYAMQRSLGQNLLAYCFPSVFLVPFCLEPLGSVFVPMKIFSALIRSHRNISKHDAETLLVPAPYGLSRYADLLLNTILAALIFFFPGGFTHRTFLALAGSHCVIYIIDSYKVLRCIRATYFTSDRVDWWAQWMLSFPCAIIATSAVFKANCQEGNDFGMCTKGWTLITYCLCAFVGHIVVHTLVLIRVVPYLAGHQACTASQTPYEEIARNSAASWFAANPIHCLRSKYIHKHDPPCDYLQPGKEYLLRTNPDIGCYFEEPEVEGEDYNTSPMAQVMSVRSVSDLTNMFACKRQPSKPSLPSVRDEDTR